MIGADLVSTSYNSVFLANQSASENWKLEKRNQKFRNSELKIEFCESEAIKSS